MARSGTARGSLVLSVVDLVEHSGVLMQSGMEHAVLDAVASRLIARTPAWDELRIAGIESRNADLHGDAFTAAGSCTVKSAEEPYFVVRLNEIRQQGGDYLSALSANTRSQLRRSLREYSKRGSLTVQRNRVRFRVENAAVAVVRAFRRR